MDLMIHMGLLNVLVNRLETSIKDLKESHNADKQRGKEAARARDDDEDIELIFRKRIKMDFSPPRFIPVSCVLTIALNLFNKFGWISFKF